jgi:NAD(P)H-dependent FMN reductase
MKILAFGASNSKDSINKKLAHHIANLFINAEYDLIDLNDYECAIYSPEREKEGFPIQIQTFMNKLEEADLIIISFAEYNGSYTTAFKNIFDWCSTYKGKTFENKSFILLSTSMGPRGGVGVLEAALERFPRHGAEILASFSLPYFNENFNELDGITHNELKVEISSFVEKLSIQLAS